MCAWAVWIVVCEPRKYIRDICSVWPIPVGYDETSSSMYSTFHVHTSFVRPDPTQPHATALARSRFALVDMYTTPRAGPRVARPHRRAARGLAATSYAVHITTSRTGDAPHDSSIPPQPQERRSRSLSQAVSLDSSGRAMLLGCMDRKVMRASSALPIAHRNTSYAVQHFICAAAMPPRSRPR